jgi:hypothetical protein
MQANRIPLLITALAATAMLVPAAVFASKPKPVAYLYGASCTKKEGCKRSLYTNTTEKEIMTLILGLRCKSAGSTIYLNQDKPIKIRKSGSFAANITVSSNDAGGTKVMGTAKLKGKVKRRKRVRLSWSIDELVPGCANTTHGEKTFEYKRPVYGG